MAEQPVDYQNLIYIGKGTSFELIRGEKGFELKADGKPAQGFNPETKEKPFVQIRDNRELTEEQSGINENTSFIFPDGKLMQIKLEAGKPPALVERILSNDEAAPDKIGAKNYYEIYSASLKKLVDKAPAPKAAGNALKIEGDSHYDVRVVKDQLVVWDETNNKIAQTIKNGKPTDVILLDKDGKMPEGITEATRFAISSKSTYDPSIKPGPFVPDKEIRAKRNTLLRNFSGHFSGGTEAQSQSGTRMRREDEGPRMSPRKSDPVPQAEENKPANEAPQPKTGANATDKTNDINSVRPDVLNAAVDLVRGITNMLTPHQPSAAESNAPKGSGELVAGRTNKPGSLNV